jgi:hypothetical protein
MSQFQLWKEFYRVLTHTHYFSYHDRMEQLLIIPNTSHLILIIYINYIAVKKIVNNKYFHRTCESEVGWCKSYVQEDTVHVLKAIIDG